jgi:hypothetical protein
MSKIVAFREAIMAGLQTTITDLKEVDWYDGVFDQNDIDDWSVRTPAAFVSVTNGPIKTHSTGEMNTALRVVVCIIDEDKRKPRDADARAWKICEDTATYVHQNTFGDENAGIACDVKMRRLSHPLLRHQGIAIGIVEWESTLTIGHNRVIERDHVWHNGVMVTQTPPGLSGRGTPYNEQGRALTEVLGLPVDDEGFAGNSTLDQGVAEKQMTNDQNYEPPQ